MKTTDASRHARLGNLAAKFRRAIRGIGIAATVGSCLLTWSGCTRNKYRAKTDREIYYLLDEKRGQSCEQGADIIRIEVDPRSRMFDPFNPDRPPMPEDDPQANRFMQCVDKKKGYPLWEANGRTNIVENPQWWNYLPLDERGVLVLDLDDAVRIGLLHSPDYQRNLETMYLSALDVSIERFRFDSQFFYSRGFNYVRNGVLRGDTTVVRGGPNSASMSKRFAAGGTLIADFANSLTWQIAGPDNFTAPSLLSFTFIQPLLRGGGRDVVLERLTLAERALLTNVRAFERYRRGFYTEIATGAGADTTPSRQGGAFGGAGLGGFDALGTVFANAGGGGFGGGGGAVQNASGYIGLLQDQLNIENQKETITRLQDIYLQYEDSYRELLLTMPTTQTEIPQQQLQVAQALQEVYQAQSTLLNLQTAYEQQLDGFKRTLGLPPYLCIEIKGELLDRFQLISIDLRNRRTQLSNFRAYIGQSNSRILSQTKTERDLETGESYRTIGVEPEVVQELSELAKRVQPAYQVLDEILTSDVPLVRADIEYLKSVIPERRRQLSRLKDIADRERGMVCSLLPLGDFNTTFLEGEGLESLPDELTAELDTLVGKIEAQESELQTLAQSIDATLRNMDGFASDRERFDHISTEILLASQDLIAAINESVLAIQLVQARARNQSAVLPEIDLEPRDALEIARQNRRDWLIRKAALVDTWRRIEFVADDLESVLDVTFSGDVGNLGSDNPFGFFGNDGTLRAGLVWDAPITRIQERNNYRQILIQFQQARRAFYQYEDGVWTSLRTTLRQARQSQLDFEIQRFAVQNAALQISVNEDIRQINETLGQGSGATAARDAVQGINAFLNTQSQLIGLYSTFESRRRVLDRDLGTMQIDAEGLWIDPGPITLETVGGGFSQAVRNYGLTPEEIMRADAEELVCPPIEIVPSDRIPVSEDDDSAIIGAPAIEAPLDNGVQNRRATPFQPVSYVPSRGSVAPTQSQPATQQPVTQQPAATGFTGDATLNRSGRITPRGTQTTTSMDFMGLPTVPSHR